MSASAKALVLVAAIVLAGCGGSGGDATAPEPTPHLPGQGPAPAPGPGVPDPGIPDPGNPNQGVQGGYVLAQINSSQPGQLVTISNPDGAVIGLYRFQATTLTLDALQTFELALRYTDDKTEYGLDDSGEFKQAGPMTEGALPLTFTSAIYGDSFTGIVLQDIVAIQYDFDGDGQPETTFSFRRAG